MSPVTVVDRERSLDEIAVSEVFRPGILTVPPEAGLRWVAAMMATHHVHALVVPTSAYLTAERVRVVTDLQLVRAVTAHGVDGAEAGDIAAEPAVTIAPGDSLATAIGLMAQAGTAHLLVAEPGAPLAAGMLSSLDVASVLAHGANRLAPVRSLAATSYREFGGEGDLASVRIRDVVRVGIVATPPATPLREVARIMAFQRIHSVAVAGVTRDDGGERLTWGVVDDMALVRAAHEDAATAAELASTEPSVVAADQLLLEAMRTMAGEDVAHVVVVTSDGSPLGVLSTLDVARVCSVTR